MILIFTFYILTGLGMYVYSVIKSWEFTGNWYFDIEDGQVGICKIPKWIIFWLEWIIKKVKR
ncbi:hypothetical protein PQE75_gp080 [Bacillus phage vB_BcoS-136]|uniref:Uncharacterized protein n=1 Tax=Bacillus phage vB_BcoS-136 TaxID=2419619 RepID=A0A3G3BVD3_9CAUD|nr:hypothetical protein PQE75_gp080 [Bacillus phage vB_BcoS-136]AYP68212.1 hypothetical protein vBBcoS136_00080 [Bacillus phage vB_BcoS-136]